MRGTQTGLQSLHALTRRHTVAVARGRFTSWVRILPTRYPTFSLVTTTRTIGMSSGRTHSLKLFQHSKSGSTAAAAGKDDIVFHRPLHRADHSYLLRSTFTFWRFMIHVPLSQNEMRVSYSVNNGIEMDFFVPGRNQNMRCAAYSVSSSCARVGIERHTHILTIYASATASAQGLTPMISADPVSRVAMTLCGLICWKNTKRHHIMH
jgi:hypothetical protein